MICTTNLAEDLSAGDQCSLLTLVSRDQACSTMASEVVGW